MRIDQQLLNGFVAVGVSLSFGCSDSGVDRICEELRCDDSNECTEDVCDPADRRVCVFIPVPEGTACGNAQLCDAAGTCGDCNRDEDCPPSLNDCASARCEGGVCAVSAIADGTPCAGGECREGTCAIDDAVLPCTEPGVRNAIAAGGGPYSFDCDGPTTITTTAEIIIDREVILLGEGNLILDGNGDHRVLSVLEGAIAQLDGIDLTGGVATRVLDEQSCGALDNEGILTLANATLTRNSAGEGGGGGLCNSGLLTIIDSVVAHNDAKACGGIFNNGAATLTDSTVSTNSVAAGGGGICSSGSLRLIRSTVSANSAGYAGAIESSGTLMVTNSTISGNRAEEGPGGLFHVGSGTIASSTVSGNDVDGEPSDIRNVGTLTVVNTVIEGSCIGETEGLLSSGYNLESPADTCGFGAPTDLSGVAPDELKLGPLGDNGGPTATHPLEEGSFAIDRIPTSSCTQPTDQRGVDRPQGTACDVGAFERDAI